MSTLPMAPRCGHWQPQIKMATIAKKKEKEGKKQASFIYKISSSFHAIFVRFPLRRPDRLLFAANSTTSAIYQQVKQTQTGVGLRN